MQRMQSWKKILSVSIKATTFSCIGIGALISASTQALAQYATYYVNPVSGSDTADGAVSTPFKTIQKAQSVVRTRNAAMTGDIHIYLSGGTYPLTSNLNFQAADSGFNGHRVVYLAQPYTAPVVTGARNITGWTQYDSAKNIWSASARGMNFRQLYINGARATRARTINYQGANDLGPYSTGLVWKTANKTISVPGSNFSPGWNRLTSTVEMVINRHWQTVRTKIASVAASGRNFEITPTTTSQNILWNTPYAQFLSPKPTYYFENSLDFLDAPGEFYLDTAANKVYYIPRSGEQANLNNANYVMAPGTSRILDINGASNISFQWITFEGSNYLPADGSTVELQSNFMFKPTTWQTQAIPGGVRVRNASGVHLQYCTVRRMGGAGIEFTDSTNGCVIDHGNVYDVAGNGIEVYTDVNNVPGKGSIDTSHTSINDRITNTFVHEVGRDYSGASGIIATYPKGITINHNEIYNCPYNGISLGWGWTSSATVLGGNKVNYNNVHHVMQLHDDAAGIYTLSLNSPQSEIAYNYIHDISRSGWAELNAISGIYFDEGSSGFNAHNNSIDPLIRQKLNYNVPATGNGITISGNDTPDPAVNVGAGPVDYAPAQGGPTVGSSR